MRLSNFTQLAALATLVPVAIADFYIYKVHANDIFGENDEFWQIFDGPPSCDDQRGTTAWNNLSDVSGDKRGIRCEEDGCSFGSDPSDIDVLEMNFRGDPIYHWTIYKDRNYVMTGLDGSTFRGSCTPDDSDDFSCLNVLSGTDAGYRKFHCETDLTASDING
ncbi:hypothetical protein PspLS_09850 [Pyricularia sp. CBS 133598]|nr:hypothetical protein PspLS_09850 [Pyricularia sp. CBS 133598]